MFWRSHSALYKMRNKILSWISFLFQETFFFPEVFFLFSFSLSSHPKGSCGWAIQRLNLNHLKSIWTHHLPNVCLPPVFSQKAVCQFLWRVNMVCSFYQQAGLVKGRLTGFTNRIFRIWYQSALNLCWLGSLAAVTKLGKVKCDKPQGWAGSSYVRREM